MYPVEISHERRRVPVPSPVEKYQEVVIKGQFRDRVIKPFVCYKSHLI